MSSRKRTGQPERLERYRSVLQLLRTNSEFRKDQVCERLGSESSSFLSRVLNELVSQGWILKESDDRVTTTQSQRECYRWNSQRPFDEQVWISEQTSGSIASSTPAFERPRERLLEHGAMNLKNSELIAILIRSGRQGESAVQAGEKVAMAFSDDLSRLPSCHAKELKSISKVIANTAYCQIMAGIELGRRVAAHAKERHKPSKIGGSADAINFCQIHFERLIHDSTREEFHILTLDTKNQVIQSHQVSVGTLDASLVHPREVFRPAIKDAASSIIMVHNHPSGDPTPSREDVQVTRRIESAGELLGIDVLDHIVLGNPKSISIRDET